MRLVIIFCAYWYVWLFIYTVATSNVDNGENDPLTSVFKQFGDRLEELIKKNGGTLCKTTEVKMLHSPSTASNPEEGVSIALHL